MIIEMFKTNIENNSLGNPFGFSNLEVYRSARFILLYESMKDHYNKKGLREHFNKEKYIKLYAETLYQNTKQVFKTKSIKVTALWNELVNDLQCHLVVADYKEKLAFVFNAAHEEIDKFVDTFPDDEANNEFKLAIQVSNYERKHYFDRSFAEVADEFVASQKEKNNILPINKPV